ncbi:SDR family oxidoreductase [Amycolatopsis sp. SID8362]|uniref:SDR family oxidoreductase n=1 Tax=Amycolatopsis sp. SID8362 TaxID=2690346 RepID=UPI00136F4CBC|nr:SDR family oxidoreductase [Amycolatopsis sp. SID8362]NBH07405.1 SDR family NAD(P)-dependent oxidoreductase [Amycolatopsis sp. SID8362]NED44101.1 SDR family oxidoreductase [Amycolatopsis sp. SID8362]
MPTEKITLVTGANKGLGLATARQLAERGHTVLLGSRDAERGARAATQLAEAGVTVQPLRIDVTDNDSVREAAESIDREYGRLDVLVNNAGVLIRNPAPEVTAEAMRPEFETNVFGLVRVTHTLLPLLRKSRAARIVNVASDSAMFSKTGEPGTMFARSHESFAYSATKAAVNMLTVKYANAFLDDPELAHIQVNSVTPGYTATDLNGFSGVRTVDEGAGASVYWATEGAGTGGFYDDEGRLPW